MPRLKALNPETVTGKSKELLEGVQAELGMTPKEKNASASKRLAEKQARAGIPYDFYRQKAHQARSDFFTGLFVD